MTAVSDGEGEQGTSEVKVPDGRGEKRGVGRKERDVGGERKPGDAVEAAEAKEDGGEISLKLAAAGVAMLDADVGADGRSGDEVDELDAEKSKDASVSLRLTAVGSAARRK